MVEHGFSNFDALQTSVNSAKMMEIDQEYGTLDVGKFADFLVLDENPLQNIKKVQQEDKQVYKKANWYNRLPF